MKYGASKEPNAEMIAEGEWLPLVGHLLATSGDSLERHVPVASKGVFQAESWARVFLLWPGTAVLTKTWARSLIFFVGMWVLMRPPEGLARMTWQKGPTSIPESVVRTARHFRFTALSLRNGQHEYISHGLSSFGLLKGSCKVSYGGLLSAATASAATISFPEPVSYDGWYAVTGSGLPELDPRMYILEASLDGHEWARVAASWSDCGCFNSPASTSTNL